MFRSEEGEKKSGRFSAQTLTCQRCGKTFDSRKNAEVCPACQAYLRQRESEAEGYFYAAQDRGEEFPAGKEAFFDTVLAHRDAVLERYKPEDPVFADAEWESLVKEYQELSEPEALDLLTVLTEASVHIIGSNAIGTRFMLPGFYPGTAADFADIFAVGYHMLQVEVELNAETVIYLFFSKDPYLPVFPFAVSLPRSFAERESKVGHSIHEDLFTTLCPNLAYPVLPLGELKEAVRQSDDVPGTLSVPAVLRWIGDAMSGTGNCSICAQMA